MPELTMDAFYKSPYGKVDLRDYKVLLPPRMRPYAESDFMRDPTGIASGSCDRFMWYTYARKLENYIMALRHIFNTGQGVIMEKSPYSHYCHVDAAYNAGWIKKESWKAMKTVYWLTLHFLLRPNLVIYLDAPVDVVQKKCKALGKEYDQDSPVLNNTQYMNDLYNLHKKDYLKGCQPHSHVLVYDWSEPGETEVVVEDIEGLNFDYWGAFDAPQKDWRLYNDEYATKYRMRYSQARDFARIMNLASSHRKYDAEELFHTGEEVEQMKHVLKLVKGREWKVSSLILVRLLAASSPQVLVGIQHGRGRPEPALQLWVAR